MTEAQDLLKSALFKGCPEAFIPVEKTYLVLDRDGTIVGRFSDKKKARAKRDRLDLQYGAVRYRVEVAQ